MLLPYQEVLNKKENAKSTATNHVGEGRYSTTAFIISFVWKNGKWLVER